jgi:hypothetical protein
MNERLNATKVLSRQKIYETFISPGFFIAETIALLLAYFLVSGFVKSIDSAGFNYQLYPLYDLISRFISGSFGIAFFKLLFAEGPFLFILYISLFPIIFYLAINSVFRLGLEKKVGAIELVTYGPADGSSYFMASFIKDIFFTLIHFLVMIIFLTFAAKINNLVLGSSFLQAIIPAFLLVIALFSFGILAHVVSENPASAIVIFLGIILLFVMLLMGSFTIVSGYVQNLSAVFSWIIKWVSPFFYWSISLRALETESLGFFTLGAGLSLVLTMTILFFSHIILKKKGVRV